MTLRGVDWVPLLSGSLVGSAVLAGCVVATSDSPPLTLVRLALVALAAAAALILDDPAAAVVDAVPRTRRRRTLARTAAVVVPLTVWAAGVLALELRSAATPAVALLIEGAGVLAVSVALAATLRFAGRDEPGDVAATAVGAAMLALLVFPQPWSAALFPVEGGWTRSSFFWGAIIATSAAVVVVASADAQGRRGLSHLPLGAAPVRARTPRR